MPYREWQLSSGHFSIPTIPGGAKRRTISPGHRDREIDSIHRFGLGCRPPRLAWEQTEQGGQKETTQTGTIGSCFGFPGQGFYGWQNGQEELQFYSVGGLSPMLGTTLDQFSGENPIAREQGIVNWEQASRRSWPVRIPSFPLVFLTRRKCEQRTNDASGKWWPV